MYPKKKTPKGKIENQARRGFLVGYDHVDGTKAYRVLSKNEIVISPHVEFLDKIDKGVLMPDVELLQDSTKHKIAEQPDEKGEDVEEEKAENDDDSPVDPQVDDLSDPSYHVTVTCH